MLGHYMTAFESHKGFDSRYQEKASKTADVMTRRGYYNTFTLANRVFEGISPERSKHYLYPLTTHTWKFLLGRIPRCAEAVEMILLILNIPMKLAYVYTDIMEVGMLFANYEAIISNCHVRVNSQLALQVKR